MKDRPSLQWRIAVKLAGSLTSMQAKHTFERNNINVFEFEFAKQIGVFNTF